MAKHVVAAVRDIPAGGRKAVTVKGRPIVVFNLHGEFFGLLNRCPHQGAMLSEGFLGGLLEGEEPDKVRCTRLGEIIRCPWHGWEFDIRTGQSWCDPERVRTRTYPVKVSPGRTLVEGPYVAESIPVTVEDDYVVVEV
jgi:3-phenylpropionate/trans-cinnamate dioxygenase ferredoxin subunit